MFAALFALLYAAHLLADYPFQTDYQAAHKDKCGAAGWRANLAHAGTHVVLSAVMLTAGFLCIDGFAPGFVPAAVGLAWIGATHSFIDRRWPVARWMAFARQAGFAQHGGAAHVDQTFHVTALVIAALIMSAL
ncbi:DUF3307 domain-containing protein [Streptomyces sp. NPDC002586]